MANPTLRINDNNDTRPIWSNGDMKTRLGDLYPKELYTSTASNYYGRKTPHFALTSKRGWTKCYVAMRPYASAAAYAPEYAYGETKYSLHVFRVRRKCRIFRGEKELLSLYAGDEIGTEGKSIAGLKHPDRLSINGYRKNGKWTYTVGNYWCDTDINLYSSRPTVYGRW